MVGEASNDTVISFMVAADYPRIVLRPAGTTCDDKLPVLIWIYWGGLYARSTADPQYNLSGIASVGQQIGKLIIAGRTHHPVSHL
jgi:hypothetical protein